VYTSYPTRSKQADPNHTEQSSPEILPQT